MKDVSLGEGVKLDVMIKKSMLMSSRRTMYHLPSHRFRQALLLHQLILRPQAKKRIFVGLQCHLWLHEPRKQWSKATNLHLQCHPPSNNHQLLSQAVVLGLHQLRQEKKLINVDCR
jgi:hypothetical protein